MPETRIDLGGRGLVVVWGDDEDAQEGLVAALSAGRSRMLDDAVQLTRQEALEIADALRDAAGRARRRRL